jgi:dihydrofolate reductase
MKCQYYTAASLDGFIADAENSLDWLLQFGNTDGTGYPEFIRAVGAMVMGSTTYEWILDNHVKAGADDAQPWPYEIPAWVLTSRDLPTAEGGDIRFRAGDVGPLFEEMAEAAGDRNLWIVGGGDLAGQFHDRGLLDEIIVTIAPVTLGGGAPLLPRRIAMPSLQLVSSRAFADTYVEICYAVPTARSAPGL